MKRQLVTTCLYFLIVLGLAVNGWSQGKATIIGRVIDGSGAILQGAQVQLQPSGLSLAANDHGEFAIADLAPGAYKLVVSYVGFQPFESDIKLEAGEVKHLDATMEVASHFEDIIVTAERVHGEAEAINRTRSSDNVLQVLPSEVITSLPNANVADALGRLPSVTLGRDEGEGVYAQVRGTEPRLTNVTINGITVPSPESTVRQVRLDAIPADLVESVEINKTLSANQDGDGIGGSVNLKTKTASDAPTVVVSGLGGHNAILGGRNNDQFGLTLGNRFGVQKKLGLLVGATYDFNGRGIDDVEPTIDPTSTFATPLYTQNTIREYRYYRTRWGLAGSADYKLGDFSSIFLHALYSNLKDYGDKWYYAPLASGNPKFYTSSKRPQYTIGSANLGGRHALASSLLTWELSAARSSELDSAGNPKADFSWIGPKLTCGYDPSAQTNMYVPHFGNGCESAGTPLQNPANWAYKDLTTSTGSTAQVNLGAAAAYSLNYQAGSHFGMFEFGGKFRNAHKFQDATETVYDGWGSTAYPMTQLLDTFSSDNYYNKVYFGGHYGPVSSFNKVVDLTQSSLSNFVDGYKTAAASYPNQFDLIERISAGYAMNSLQMGRVRLQTGLRLEATQMDTVGNLVTLYPAGSKNCVSSSGCGVPSPVTNNLSYVDALPSVQVRYDVTRDSDFRVVYGRGLSRPDAYQLVPYATVDDSASPVAVSIGNPSLKASHANNFDVLYERFLKPVGMIQAGFFYKRITDTLVNTLYTPASGLYAGDAVSQWVNVGTGNLYGFEVSYQQHLTRLPGALAGLGIFANYSWTGSNVNNLPGRSDSPAMQRQAPGTGNFSPTFDRGRLSVRLGMTYNAPSIYQYGYQAAADPGKLGPLGPAGDQYTYSHLQIDAQGTITVARGLQAVFYGLNLNDEVYGLYTGSKQFVRQREYYKPTIAAGFKYTLNRER